MKRATICLVAVLLATAPPGCTHNLLTLDKDGDLMQRTSAASVSKLDTEGNQQAAYHGLAHTLSKQDAEGIWVNTPGPVGLASLPMPTGGIFQLVSPKDLILKGIKWTPEPKAGESAFQADEVGS